MAELARTFNGTVYTDTDILHAYPSDCPHSGNHACPTCDHDGYYARKHGSVCPWFEGDDHDDHA